MATTPVTRPIGQRAPLGRLLAGASTAGATALGIDAFILSGYPHLEDAFRVGEGVIPELTRPGRSSPPGRVEVALSVGAARR